MIISLNEPSYELMRRFAEAYLREFDGATLNVIELGSQGHDGQPEYRQIFEQPNWSHRTLDTIAREHTDIVVNDPCNWRSSRDASVEVVIAGHGLERFEFPARTMREIARILRPGGLACLVMPSADPEPPDRPHRWQLDADRLRTLAKRASLRIVEAFTASRLGVWQETFGVLQEPPWSNLAIQPAFPEVLDEGVARGFFLEWIARRPPNADYYLNVAQVMFDEGRLGKATAALRYGLDLTPRMRNSSFTSIISANRFRGRMKSMSRTSTCTPRTHPA